MITYEIGEKKITKSMSAESREKILNVKAVKLGS